MERGERKQKKKQKGKSKKNETKSKIAIFDGLFACLLHSPGRSSHYVLALKQFEQPLPAMFPFLPPWFHPGSSVPSFSSPKQMKGSRLKVQTDIIYRSNHLVAATTTASARRA